MSDTEETTTRDDDRALMEALKAAHDRGDARAVNRLVAKVWEKHGDLIKRATRSMPDSEAAAWEALHQMTDEDGVRYFLADFNEPLEAYAAVMAKSRHARAAGLLSKKIVRNDALYSTRSRSLDAIVEEHGDRFASASSLEALEAAKRRETRSIREGFERISGSLTPKQRAAVLRYGNLHRDDAQREMATQDEAARSLVISQQALSQMLDRVRERIENDAALRTALGRLVDDEQRVEEAAKESAKRRKPSENAASNDATDAARETLEEELARARAILGMVAA